MTYQQELKSWLSPSPKATSTAPAIGSPAPSTLLSSVPSDKPQIITFLRHCGCPFAEKTFLRLRSSALSHPDITFLAVSHSDQAATDQWVQAVGGAGKVHVIVDSERDKYADWGLGISNFWHVLSPGGMWNVYKMGKEEGIWNRPTQSGSRWQTSGSFALDDQGIVRWSRAAPSADWIPDFEEAVEAVHG